MQLDRRTVLTGAAVLAASLSLQTRSPAAANQVLSAEWEKVYTLPQALQAPRQWNATCIISGSRILRASRRFALSRVSYLEHASHVASYMAAIVARTLCVADPARLAAEPLGSGTRRGMCLIMCWLCWGRRSTCPLIPELSCWTSVLQGPTQCTVRPVPSSSPRSHVTNFT